jgi:protein O-mannosyl-transferase
VNHQTGQFRPLCSPGFICLLLVLASLAVYLPVRHFGFVDYDDSGYFFNNPQVLSGLTWPNIQWAFTNGEYANWHPLTWLSLMLDATLFGAGAAGPHVTNVLLHTANSILLFLLFLRMTGDIWRSAAVGILFAIHPLHVESVAWISERKDVLSAFFGLLALLCYVRYVELIGDKRAGNPSPPEEEAEAEPHILNRQPSGDRSPAKIEAGSPPAVLFYVLTLFFFVCSLMSKPMLVTLPCVLLLLDFWPLQRFNRPNLQRIVVEKIPFFLLTIAACVVTYIVQRNGFAVVPLSDIPFDARVGNAFVSYARYIGKIFWPTRLAAIYPYPGYWPGFIVYLSLLLFAGISLAAFDQRKKFPWLFSGWFWFAGMLVPVIGLVQVGPQAMADRYAYLPMAGILVIAVWGIGEFCRARRPSRLLILAMSVILFIACAWRARDQVGTWRNDESLFGHTLAVTRDNYIAELDMGYWYSRNGNVRKALEYYDTARKMAPNDSSALYNVGNAFARLGDWKDAIRNYQRALHIVPNQPDVMNNLGIALAQSNQLAQAISYFQAALKLKPDFADAQNNLGSALFRQGDYVQAAEAFYAAAQNEPANPEFVINLGDTLVRLGKKPAAAECYQQALQLEPDNQAVRNKLQALESSPAGNAGNKR